MTCPTCGCEHASSSGGEFHSEDHEINGVPMTVLVLVGETLRCPRGHEWVSPLSIEEAIAKQKAKMQERYTLEASIAWLRKMSQKDFCLGEQNYARLLLKAGIGIAETEKLDLTAQP